MNIIDKSLFRPVKRDHINQPFGVNYCEFYKQMVYGLGGGAGEVVLFDELKKLL